MELASLIVSVVGFAVTFVGVGIAVYQARSAKLVAEQSEKLIKHMADLSEAQSHTARTIGEISIIDAYMAREYSKPRPDMGTVARQYAALLARAIVLVGNEAELHIMVGELGNDAAS